MGQLLTGNPWLCYSAAAVFGLIVGSFLNVVIRRLPQMMEQQWRASAAEARDQAAATESAPTLSLAQPRSRCPHCGTPIRAVHNIPLLSYLWLRGRCAGCNTGISWQYPVVEAAAALLAVAVVSRFGATPFTVLALVFSWTLLALAVIDWRTQLLPDSLTLPLLWLGLLSSLGFDAGYARIDPASAIAGAAAGYLSLWIVFQVFLRLTGKEGMGYGDFKLLAAIGAWTGWQNLPLVLLTASLTGALIGGLLIASRRLDRATPMPFGPWLAMAGWLALTAGDTIMSAYSSLAGLR